MLPEKESPSFRRGENVKKKEIDSGTWEVTKKEK
jgi:hypothetical protein